MPRPGQPSDDESSAPESGTVRELPPEMNTSDRGTDAGGSDTDPTRRKDDPAQANEEK
jgi:hypothetical protein